MSDSHNNSNVICLNSSALQYVSIIFAVTKVLLLVPLCIPVLVVAHQRWRQRRSGTTMSHSDILTYHMVAVETLGLLMSALSCYLYVTYIPSLSVVLTISFATTFTGQLFYQCLTCTDRFLAVVHPVTYLRLRGHNAVKIIYTSTGFVLLLCSAWLSFTILHTPDLVAIPTFLFLILSLIVVSFCSLAVLRALKRPGPGEGDRVNQSKRRAIYTIMTIMAVLLVWFLGILVCLALSLFEVVREQCLLWSLSLYFTLPSSLVTPLLFLHRAEKLPCCSYRSG